MPFDSRLFMWLAEREAPPVEPEASGGASGSAWPFLVAAGLVLGLVCFVVWRYPA